MIDLIHMMESGGNSSLFLSLMGRPAPVVADPEKIQQLVDMGFDRDMATYYNI